MQHTDVLRPHPEPVGRKLRQHRLVALAVRLEAGGERHRAVRLDRHADRVEVAGAGEALVGGDLCCPAALLDERAEANADEAALLAQAPLPLAEGVVVDELPRPPDRSGVAAAVVAAARRRDGGLPVRQAVAKP